MTSRTDPPSSRAGHGGIDPGGVGTTSAGQQVDESTVNLAIELDAMAVLRARGYRVVVSRTQDTTVGLGPRYPDRITDCLHPSPLAPVLFIEWTISGLAASRAGSVTPPVIYFGFGRVPGQARRATA
jgi:hypothetical protein